MAVLLCVSCMFCYYDFFVGIQKEVGSGRSLVAICVILQTNTCDVNTELLILLISCLVLSLFHNISAIHVC